MTPAETVEQESQATSDQDLRIPKWRFDQVLCKNRELKDQLQKAFTLIEQQEAYINRLEQIVRRSNG